MKRYKVLRNNLKSPFKQFQYELGKQYTCKDFDQDPQNDCSKGFYATKADGIIYSYYNDGECEVFECEVGGKKVEIDAYKMRYEKIKITRKLPIEELKILIQKQSNKMDWDYYQAVFPINPLEFPKKELTQKHKELLREWVSLLDSVDGSIMESVMESVKDLDDYLVWTSVWYPVFNSVGNSVTDSVVHSVWDTLESSVRVLDEGSVWDLVWDALKGAVLDTFKSTTRYSVVMDSLYNSLYNLIQVYITSLLPNIFGDSETNPYQSGIDLWREGFVPSYDGKTWRLHQGKDAKAVYEWDGKC